MEVTLARWLPGDVPFARRRPLQPKEAGAQFLPCRRCKRGHGNAHLAIPDLPRRIDPRLHGEPAIPRGTTIRLRVRPIDLQIHPLPLRRHLKLAIPLDMLWVGTKKSLRYIPTPELLRLRGYHRVRLQIQLFIRTRKQQVQIPRGPARSNFRSWHRHGLAQITLRCVHRGNASPLPGIRVGGQVKIAVRSLTLQDRHIRRQIHHRIARQLRHREFSRATNRGEVLQRTLWLPQRMVAAQLKAAQHPHPRTVHIAIRIIQKMNSRQPGALFQMPNHDIGPIDAQQPLLIAQTRPDAGSKRSRILRRFPGILRRAQLHGHCRSWPALSQRARDQIAANQQLQHLARLRRPIILHAHLHC